MEKREGRSAPIPLAAVPRSYSQERKRWPPFVKAASETQETGAERDREEILSQIEWLTGADKVADRY